MGLAGLSVGSVNPHVVTEWNKSGLLEGFHVLGQMMLAIGHPNKLEFKVMELSEHFLGFLGILNKSLRAGFVKLLVHGRVEAVTDGVALILGVLDELLVVAGSDLVAIKDKGKGDVKWHIL